MKKIICIFISFFSIILPAATPDYSKIENDLKAGKNLPNIARYVLNNKQAIAHPSWNDWINLYLKNTSTDVNSVDQWNFAKYVLASPNVAKDSRFSDIYYKFLKTGYCDSNNERTKMRYRNEEDQSGPEWYKVPCKGGAGIFNAVTALSSAAEHPLFTDMVEKALYYSRVDNIRSSKEILIDILLANSESIATFQPVAWGKWMLQLIKSGYNSDQTWVVHILFANPTVQSHPKWSKLVEQLVSNLTNSTLYGWGWINFITSQGVLSHPKWHIWSSQILSIHRPISQAQMKELLFNKNILAHKKKWIALVDSNITKLAGASESEALFIFKKLLQHAYPQDKWENFFNAYITKSKAFNLLLDPILTEPVATRLIKYRIKHELSLGHTWQGSSTIVGDIIFSSPEFINKGNWEELVTLFIKKRKKLFVLKSTFINSLHKPEWGKLASLYVKHAKVHDLHFLVPSLAYDKAIAKPVWAKLVKHYITATSQETIRYKEISDVLGQPKAISHPQWPVLVKYAIKKGQSLYDLFYWADYEFFQHPEIISILRFVINTAKIEEEYHPLFRNLSSLDSATAGWFQLMVLIINKTNEEGLELFSNKVLSTNNAQKHPRFQELVNLLLSR